MRLLKAAGASWLPLYAALYLVFLYLPVLLLPIFSVNASAVPVFPLSGLTFDWFRGLAGNDAMVNALWNSLMVAVASSLLATVLGVCAARAITRYRFRGSRPMTAVIMAPLVLPEIIIAISLLMVALQMGLGLSLVLVVLGHVLICLPYSTTVLVSGFEGFDPSYEEASTDLGETAFGTLRRVTLPILMPAIISSLLCAFTISLDEFIIAFFLSGTEPTLPIYIWGQLRFPAKLPSVLALGTLMLAASLVLLTVAEMLRRRAARRTQIEGGFLA